MAAIPFKQSKAFELMAPDLAGLQGNQEEVRKHIRDFSAWLESLPEGKYDHAYAPDKWTLRVLIGHIIDSHLIILFRLVTFARGEQGPIPGADEIIWARYSGHEKFRRQDLLEGYRRAAAFSQWMIDGLPQDAMERQGVANGITLTVRELHAYLIAHERHHMRIAKERYGI